MSDIKLFRVTGKTTKEIRGSASSLEKPLQNLIEANLASLLGIRFLASEYSTGKTHSGRIDTLGIDENNSPVIIEYKRSSHENIINQGLFYLDWLMDHQAEFKLKVMESFGTSAAELIDWSAPRLICIASDFTKYDGHAVQQMNRNIELIRYRLFGKDLLLLELVNAVNAPTVSGKKKIAKPAKVMGSDKTVAEWLSDMPPAMGTLFESLENHLVSLGDDVQRKDLKLYVAFKRLRNFATVCFQQNQLRVFLNLDPKQIALVDGFTRDVTNIGHWGTGNLEVVLKNMADLEKAKPLLLQAYEGGSHAG